MGRLDNQAAVITGAAGGLGRCLAASFVDEGARVFLADIDGERLDEHIANLRQRSSAVFGIKANLSSVEECQNVVDRAIEALSRIDILVNNAAVASTNTLWNLTESDWDATLAVNVKGLFFTLQAAAKHMAHRGGGVIVNIASIAGRAGRPLLIPYAASKAAVISITRSCAVALAPHGIRVNAIAPGMINTPMLEELRNAWAHIPPPDGPGAHSNVTAGVPLGRIAEPVDIAKAVVYLASHDSGYVTGQTLNVCGGIIMS